MKDLRPSDVRVPDVRAPEASGKPPERAGTPISERPPLKLSDRAPATPAERPAAALQRPAAERQAAGAALREKPEASIRDWGLGRERKSRSFTAPIVVAVALASLAGGAYYGYVTYLKPSEAESTIAEREIDKAPAGDPADPLRDPFDDPPPAASGRNENAKPRKAQHKPGAIPLETASNPAKGTRAAKAKAPADDLDLPDELTDDDLEGSGIARIDPKDDEDDEDVRSDHPLRRALSATDQRRPVTRNAPGNRLAPVRPKADGLEDDPDEYTIDQPRIAAKSSPRLLGPKVSIIEVQDEQPPARSADFDTEEEDAARRRATSKTLVIRPAANKAASGADDDSWMIDETRSGPRNAAERRGDGVAQVDDDHPLSSLRSRQTRTQAQAGAPAKIASRGATDSANNASPRSQGNVQAFGDPVTRPPQRSETYVVVPGDNFWTISRKQYGASRYFAALARHNQERIPDPQRLRPGMQVSTPSASVLEQRYPDLIDKAGAAGSAPIGAPDDRSDGRPMFGQPAASRPGVEREGAAAPQATGVFYGPAGQPMYRIGADDTLSSIAQKHLGRSSRWTEIYEQNRKVLPNPESLTVGTIIRLPADASQVSRGADSVLRR